MDLDSAFMSSLINYLFNKLDIEIKMGTPHNYQSLQAKHGIKIIINDSDKTLDKSRTDVAKIFIIGYLCILYI